MRFALLGDHPDGLGVALALTHTGRHVIGTYCGPPRGLESLQSAGLSVQSVGDVEEVLADPAIEAVIVAGRQAERAAQFRRALQSERHVLCVQPADVRPDIGYEAALLQKDARVVLLPLFPEAVHPGMTRLVELSGRSPGTSKVLTPGRIGTLQLVEYERWSSARSAAEPAPLTSLPGWDALRLIGAEIAEVSAFTGAEELTSNDPVLVAGRFAQGGLLRSLFLPGQVASQLRVALVASPGRAELFFPAGVTGPAHLEWLDADSASHKETWPPHNPWPAHVAAFEAALAASVSPAQDSAVVPASPLTWQDAVRGLELDDAVRRSVRYRRVSTLEYPEATEEAGFKGTMTLVGCGLLWVILLVVILSSWFPWLGWLVIPALVFFLGSQVLRWVLPTRTQGRDGAAAESPAPDLK